LESEYQWMVPGYNVKPGPNKQEFPDCMRFWLVIESDVITSQDQHMTIEAVKYVAR